MNKFKVRKVFFRKVPAETGLLIILEIFLKSNTVNVSMFS